MPSRFFRGRHALTLTVLTACCVSSGSAAASNRPLTPLKKWATETARSFDAGHTSARTVERRIAALRQTVDATAPRLLRASTTTRNIEVALSRAALDRTLARVPNRLSTETARFFFLAYQAQLERLAEQAALDRAPTGRPLTEAGAGEDADSDGVIDQVDRDSDGDGVDVSKDGSDLGWGIPDVFAARRRTLGGFCVFATEAVPNPRTAGEATAWMARAARRGCAPPKVPTRSIGGAAAKPGATWPWQIPAAWQIRPPATTRATTSTHKKTKKRKTVTLGKVGFSARNARLDRAVLTLTTSAKRPVKAVFEVLVDRRAVMKSAPQTIKKGKRSRKVTFSSAIVVKTARLRVTVVRGNRKGRGTVRLRVIDRQTPLAPVTPETGPLDPLPADPVKPGVPPVPTTCDPELDTDRDTVPDCQEIEGYAYAHFVPSLNCHDIGGAIQCGDEKTRTVTSDPKKANTDGDARVVNGITFELTDAEEWFLFRSGGKSDPSSKDSDSDGVGDVEERKRWNTEAGNPDSDGDGVQFVNGVPIGLRAELYDRAEIDGGTVPGSRFPTAPTSPDTDGDGSSDTTEILGGHTNPLVAVIPEYRLTPAPDTTFSVQIGQTTGSTYGLTNTKTDEQSKEESNSTVDSQSQSHTAEVAVELEASTGAAGKIGAKVTASYSYNNSKSHESSLTTSRADRTEAQQTYEDVLSTTTDPTGSINVSFRLTNARDDRDVTVKNLAVDAYFLCGRSQAGSSCGTAGKRAFLARLTPVGQPDGYTLAANESRLIPFTASGVPSNLLKALAANPSNLTFSAAGGDLFASSTGPNLLDSVGQSIPQNTGRLSIDDSAGKVKDYSIAAFVNRDWGKPDASQAPPMSLFDALRYAKVTATTRDISGGKVLGRVITTDTQGAEIDATASAADNFAGTWAILADAPVDKVDVGFADRVRLGVGDTVILGYVKDSDSDGLLDRQERLLGTDDTNKDSDGDGATVQCALVAPATSCPGRGAAGTPYASDYFESVVGWMAGPTKHQDNTDNRAAYAVRSDPTTCDGDNDGSYDGPGACTDGLSRKDRDPGNELANLTDPVDPDTDGDGTEDGKDSAPLRGSPPAPVENVSFKPNEMATCPHGDQGDLSICMADQGASIESPQFDLCGQTGDQLGNCTDSTGLYRISWDIDTATTAGGDGRQIQGRYEVLDGTRVLLRVDFDRDEQARRTGAGEREELFFATSKPSTTLKVRYTNTSLPGSPANYAQTHGNLDIDEVQPATFLDQSNNLNFAGIAIPGSMLNGRSTTRRLAATADGELPLPTGITTGPTLSGGSGSTYGVSIPGGQIGWRARFFVRDAKDDLSGSTATVGLMGERANGDPAVQPGDGLGDSEVSISDDTGLKHFQAVHPRTVFVQGHVRTRDLQNVEAPAATGVTEFFETGTKPINNMSVAIDKTGSQALTVVSVVLEPIGNSVKEYVGYDFPAGGEANARDVPWLAAGFTPGNGFGTGGLFGPDDPQGDPLGAMEPNLADGSLSLGTRPDGEFTFRQFRTTGGLPKVDPSYHRWSVASERTLEGDCTRDDTQPPGNPNDPDDDTAYTPLRYRELPSGSLGWVHRSTYPGDRRPLLSFVPATLEIPRTNLRISNVQGDNNCLGTQLQIDNVILGTRPAAPFGPGD